MSKLLILFFCLCLAGSAYAEDVAPLEENANINEEQVQEVNNVTSEEQTQEAQEIASEESAQEPDETVSEEQNQEPKEGVSEELMEQVEQENALDTPKKTEYEEIREVAEEIIPLPACDDERLRKEAFKYINDYFNLASNEGTLFRRRRYFVLHNLDKFKEENIANYKTEETSPVSDMIAATKINKGIAEENLRLCKNTAKDKFAGKIFLLIYPEQNGVRTRVINLVDKQRIDDEASFFYENKSE